MNIIILISLYIASGLLISEVEIQNFDKLKEMCDVVAKGLLFPDELFQGEDIFKLIRLNNIIFWPVELLFLIFVSIKYFFKK